MADPDFVHLHVHSEYSLLDGANRISNLVKAAQQDGQPALALTDHGNMFGAVELYQKCTAGDVKPIMGCEVYIAQRSRLEPHSKAKGNGYNHLTLLARNDAGYQNLIKLASIAYVEGLHFRPRIDHEVLSKHADGISCLSGCLAGALSQLAIQGKEAEAEAKAIELRDLFGPDHFWLELQRNGIDLQTKVNECVMRIHQRTGIPIVATNDIHYLRHEDCQAQDVLLCINTGAKRDDEKRFRFDTDSLFFKSRAEMGDMFRDLPESVTATMDVAEQVNTKLEFGTYHVPVFKSDTGEEPEALFERLLEEGLTRKYDATHAKARERLAYEMGVIAELGFVSYFLIVWDLIRWAREHEIPVGPGRGSAAGSIVAYLLDITQVCPLQYDLLFERFLNSARVSMPDIDIDFCKEGRERVIQYTRDRYGPENVAQIVTFGTMASRTVVRDVGRVLDIPLRDIDRIAKKVPAGPGAPNLKKALETMKDLQEIRAEREEFNELFDLSVRLEGMARHISTHAAGVVISDKPIVEYVPLAKNGDDITTQYPMTQLEELGLLKMDYLGLRTLTIIDKTCKNIRRRGLEVPDVDNLPYDNPETFRMLTAGDTLGVFQLESEGMRKLLARLQPDCFEDLIAVLALYRPGPLESGMVEMFNRRKHGEEPITYPHESMASILEDTYGCIVYQEQVMLISNSLGGFSLNEADNLRKAMGKKKPEIMAKFSAQFVEGAVVNGCDAKVAEEVWDNIVKFGGYGFNKSHSTAYAVITYQTAWLKAHHRTDYMAANLSCEMGDSDKIKALMDDIKRGGVEIFGPSIKHSGWEFLPEGEGIRFGFGAIKGTGSKSIESLIEQRAEIDGPGGLANLHTLCAGLDPSEIGKICLDALIKAGAFDDSGTNRGMIAAALDVAMSDGSRAARDRKAGQASLFGAPEPTKDQTAAVGFNPSDAWDESDTLKAEYEVLGFYLSGHPLEQRAGLVSLLADKPIAELDELPGGTNVVVAGLVMGLTELIVKKGRMAGRKMARFRLEDLSGSVGITVFPRSFEEYAELLEDGAVLLVRGKLEEDKDEPAMLLDQLMTVEQALGSLRGGLLLHIDPLDRSNLPRLREALVRYPGSQPVFFQVVGDDGQSRRVRASRDLDISLSEAFATEMAELLGDAKVALVRV